MLSPTLTDKSHASGLMGICSFLSVLLIGDTYKILILSFLGLAGHKLIHNKAKHLP